MLSFFHLGRLIFQAFFCPGSCLQLQLQLGGPQKYAQVKLHQQKFKVSGVKKKKTQEIFGQVWHQKFKGCILVSSIILPPYTLPEKLTYATYLTNGNSERFTSATPRLPNCPCWDLNQVIQPIHALSVPMASVLGASQVFHSFRSVDS